MKGSTLPSFIRQIPSPFPVAFQLFSIVLRYISSSISTGSYNKHNSVKMWVCISKLNICIFFCNYACFYFHSFRAYFHMIAMMGINTQYFQSGLEFHAEFCANTAMKFDARINMKEKNLKTEAPPCYQEVELAAARYRGACCIWLIICYRLWAHCYKILNIQLLVRLCGTLAAR